MSPALSERIAAEHAGSLRALAATGASGEPQRAALEALLTAGLPTQRDENWKYANLRPLEKLRFAPALAGAGPLATLSLSLPQPLPRYVRLVFIDGAFSSDLSASPGSTSAALSLEAGGLCGVERPSADERFALLNAAFATQTANIRVPAGSAGPVLLEIVFVARAESEAGASYPRMEVRVERGANLALIERHVSADTAASFVNSAVRIAVAPGASLTHYRLQHLSGRSIFFDTLSASLGADAAYRLHTISSGAQSARSTVRVRLEGERADLTLAGATLGDHHQVQDAYAVVEHLAPNALTEQTFRGIAAARARVAFNGKIIVASAARGTDSRQSLRGLLAGPEAEIDLRPQLEIYTDEVRSFTCCRAA
jgi:Fe-S cluster assembly protein SufD